MMNTRQARALAARLDEASKTILELCNYIDAAPPIRGLGDVHIRDVASVRLRKACARLGAKTLHELSQFSMDDMMSLPQFGVISLNEARQLLDKHGLSFRDDKHALSFWDNSNEHESVGVDPDGDLEVQP